MATLPAAEADLSHVDVPLPGAPDGWRGLLTCGLFGWRGYVDVPAAAAAVMQIPADGAPGVPGGITCYAELYCGPTGVVTARARPEPARAAELEAELSAACMIATLWGSPTQVIAAAARCSATPPPPPGHVLVGYRLGFDANHNGNWHPPGAAPRPPTAAHFRRTAPGDAYRSAVYMSAHCVRLAAAMCGACAPA